VTSLKVITCTEENIDPTSCQTCAVRFNLRGLAILLLTVVCLGSLFTVVGSYVWNWRYGLPVRNDTKMATINTVAVLATLIVAVLAGIVAIAAYAIASGQPDLDAVIRFEFSEPNSPRFYLARDPGEDPSHWPLESFKQLTGRVTLTNRSRYAARNPGIRIRFDGISGLGDIPGWDTAVFTHMVGVTEIQWDGGADRMIHGEWSRNLPGINLFGASWLRHLGTPTMTVTVVADGVSPRSRVYPIVLREWEDEPNVEVSLSES
jgi:hypothetical protein